MRGEQEAIDDRRNLPIPHRYVAHRRHDRLTGGGHLAGREAYPTSPLERLVTAGVTLLVVGGIGTLTFPCEFVIEADHLLVRSCVIRYRIPYRDITCVAPSSAPWSAPALSLRRVKVS